MEQPLDLFENLIPKRIWLGVAIALVLSAFSFAFGLVVAAVSLETKFLPSGPEVSSIKGLLVLCVGAVLMEDFRV